MSDSLKANIQLLKRIRLAIFLAGAICVIGFFAGEWGFAYAYLGTSSVGFLEQGQFGVRIDAGLIDEEAWWGVEVAYGRRFQSGKQNTLVMWYEKGIGGEFSIPGWWLAAVLFSIAGMLLVWGRGLNKKTVLACECGYSLFGIQSARCPECGAVVPADLRDANSESKGR